MMDRISEYGDLVTARECLDQACELLWKALMRSEGERRKSLGDVYNTCVRHYHDILGEIREIEGEDQ